MVIDSDAEKNSRGDSADGRETGSAGPAIKKINFFGTMPRIRVVFRIPRGLLIGESDKDSVAIRR